MNNGKASDVLKPVANDEILKFGAFENSRSILDQIIRDGARKIIQAALDDEVNAFLELNSTKVDCDGRRLVVSNGYMPSRELVTGAGNLEVCQPRVRDKSSDAEKRVKFSSSILPLYLLRSKAIDELIPWLYLKGDSWRDFSEALQSLTCGPVDAVSATTIVRLKETQAQDYDAWNKRDLSSKEYAYIWADGIHVNVRLGDQENQRQCILVWNGTTAEGEKELIAVRDAFRESEVSWKELLNDVKERGLKVDPKLAIGDGALGFWAAVREVFMKIREQQCWFHKSGNVLNYFPQSVQPRAKEALHEIWMAETRDEVYKALHALARCTAPSIPVSQSMGMS